MDVYGEDARPDNKIKNISAEYASMSFAQQVVDIVIAGFVAGVASFLLSAIAQEMSITLGVALACMYYFSRHPWGSRHGADYNEKIDELYDEYLPF